MQSGLFSEMVLIDANNDKAQGEALDISHGVPFAKPMKIYAGSYDDIKDASLVIITAGANQNLEKHDLIWLRKIFQYLNQSFPKLKNEITKEYY